MESLLNVNSFPIAVSKAIAGLLIETIPLPIAPHPALAGLMLFLQSAYVELGGFSASSGVKLTIL